MSEFSAKKLRDAMKSKIARLISRADPKAKVDASGYTPPDALDADVKTGARPLSRRLFRKGGKVVAMHGEHAHHHAGRKPRKSGGKALTANSLVNRNVREANEERDGIKHVGAFKRGGKAMHDHEDVAEDKKLIKSMVKHEAIKPGKAHGGSCRCAKCSGGSMGRAEGGKNWIKDAIKHPGSLHKALHVPKGEKIPAKKLEKATHSDKPGLAKKANLAKTLKGFHKKADGGGFDGPLITPKGSGAPVTGRPMIPSDKLVPFVPTVKKIPPRTPFKPSEADLNDMRAQGMMPRKRGGKTSVSDGELEGTRPTGGRRARAYGGQMMGHKHPSSKGKTNINIIIGTGAGKGGTPPAGAAPMAPPRLPMPPVVPPLAGAGAPAAVPPVPPVPPGGVPPVPPGMPARKAGGRVGHRSYKSVKDLDAGSGSGLGRLEKVKIYGHKA